MLEVILVLVGGNYIFLYLMYVYGYGIVGWLVMCMYLGMVGSDKVGFIKMVEFLVVVLEYVGGV